MHLKMSPAICFNLDQSKILSSGNGLNVSDFISCLENLGLILSQCGLLVMAELYFDDVLRLGFPVKHDNNDGLMPVQGLQWFDKKHC